MFSKQEKVVDEEDENIVSTHIHDKSIPSEHGGGRNGKEEEYNFHDDIPNLLSKQYIKMSFESQLKQALETFKKLPTNNCFVEVEIVAHDEDLKRKRIEEPDKWSFNEQDPSGKEN